MGASDQTRSLRTFNLLDSYLDVSGVPYHANCTPPYHCKASTCLNNPFLICRVHGFMRLYPYLYATISSIQLETRLVSPDNVFPVINSSMSVLTGPGET
ncbi:uncharacterized protein TNCV_2329221 [Trichonephila clavipes]|nr:uncharacterized protein TNCV_2329221 [Trichonephila clavipes]